MNTNGSAPSNRYQFLVEIWKELSLSKKSSEDGRYMHVFRVDDSFELEGALGTNCRITCRAFPASSVSLTIPPILRVYTSKPSPI